VTVPTIPGWIEQWYGKEPAAGKVMLNVPPGAIEPELQAPALATEVWVMESLLVHVTMPPTDTVIGFGAKAVVVMVDAPETIDTAPGPPDRVDAGAAGDDEPHAAAKLSSSAISASLKDV
jgi:hypothetical protein